MRKKERARTVWMEGWEEAAPRLLLAATCLVCYANTLSCGFVFDDISAVKDNKDVRALNISSGEFFDFMWNDFWGIPMHKEQSHKSYRPLTVFTYRLNYLVHGLSPIGYHLVNGLLHVVVTQLYFSSLTFFVQSRTALVAAVLFAVHPIHTEAVTGVVGRAELLSSIFFLLAFMAYCDGVVVGPSSSLLPADLAEVSAFAFLAMVSKEQGITVVGLCLVLELRYLQKIPTFISKVLSISPMPEQPLPNGGPSWARVLLSQGTGRSWFRVILLLAASLLLLAFRIKIMQGSSLPVFTKFDNPGSMAPPLSQGLTTAYLAAFNMLLLLWPAPLCCDWTMGSIPLVSSLSDPRNLATLVAGTLLLHTGLVWLRTRDRVASCQLALALAWLLLPFLPASNLFFPVGFVVAERVLYIPSMGFCLLVALGYSRLYRTVNSPTGRRYLMFFLGVVVVCHACKTVRRNLDWRDEESIFLSGLAVNAQNAKLYNNVGHALEGRKMYNESLLLFKQAAIVQPDDIGAHINIGRTLNHLGRYEEAEVAYWSAKTLLPRAKPGEKLVTRIAPNSLNLFLNLGNLIAKNLSRLEEADRLYRQAIAMRSDYIQAYINRGDVLIKMNRSDEAVVVYKEALKIDEKNPDLYYNLGVVAIEQKQPELGLQYLNTALEHDPNHVEALLNSAILIQELGRADFQQLARDRLLTLLKAQPKNERALFNLAMITMDQGESWEAEYYFKKAIAAKPDFRGALFNLALLLTEEQRSLEAVPFLETLLNNYPHHIKGLVLLGDIYTNVLKNLDEAEKCYNRILALEPEHVQALHNLCVVEVERGRLEQAERCLLKAAGLAPHEDYIVKHLNIVRGKLRRKNAKSRPVS